MALRTSLEARITAAWQRRGVLPWLLLPLALVYRAVLALRSAAYSAGLRRTSHAGVPVVVVGNLYVGGTGKTPLTIELVRSLQQRGWHPGVVSRGYGARSAAAPRLVDAGASVDAVGDEPLLIARATQAPVSVGADRVAAAAALLAAAPDCDVIVADDGLQHLRLARDFEIAVVDERRLGNGWLLPAGPLREPARRLAAVDAIVAHNTDCAALPAGAASCYAMRTALAGSAYALADRGCTLGLDELRERQRSGSIRITAAAGIGVPQRFFEMLAGAGLQIQPLALPDHYDYADDSFAGLDADVVLITEKDAVKCERIAALRQDPRFWVIPLLARIDSALVDRLAAALDRLKKEPHGPTPV